MDKNQLVNKELRETWKKKRFDSRQIQIIVILPTLLCFGLCVIGWIDSNVSNDRVQETVREIQFTHLAIGVQFYKARDPITSLSL